MAENFNIFDFQLDTQDMESIQSLDTGSSIFLSHTDPEIVKWLGTVKFNI